MVPDHKEQTSYNKSECMSQLTGEPSSLWCLRESEESSVKGAAGQIRASHLQLGGLPGGQDKWETSRPSEDDLTFEHIETLVT